MPSAFLAMLCASHVMALPDLNLMSYQPNHQYTHHQLASLDTIRVLKNRHHGEPIDYDWKLLEGSGLHAIVTPLKHWEMLPTQGRN